MEPAIWLAIGALLFVGLVFFGFWTIAKAKLPDWAGWFFGAIVLIVILFALVYLVRGGYAGGVPRLVAP